MRPATENAAQRAQTFHRLCGVIVDEFSGNASTLDEGLTLTGDLGLDRVDLLQLFTAVEYAFDIDMPDSLTREIVTVGDVVDAILQLEDAGDCADIVLEGEV